MSIRELLLQEKLHKALQAVCEKLNQQEQAANVSTHTLEPLRRFNINYDYDDDDDVEENTIPLNEIVSQIPPSVITPVLPTLEPEDSLSMGDEHLSTNPKKESDEFIKSSVEDLIPIPSESEDTSDSDSDCDLPFYDNSFTFSNPLFNDNDDFTSSDDKSLLEEDVSKENFKIYSNPLFEFDDVYISSDVNPLFNEVLEDIESKDSYVSKLDEPDLLVTPLSKLNEDECFDPGGDVDEIKLLPYRDLSTPKISVASILEGFTDKPPLEENDDLFDLESKENEWKKILYDAPIDDLMTVGKVFDPGIHEKTFSPTYVSLPFEDRHYLSLTYVIWIFLLYFTYLVDSSLPLSSGSEDIIFDPGISVFSFYSLEPVVYKSPLEICSSTLFNPNITMIWGEIAPDYEDFRARVPILFSVRCQKPGHLSRSRLGCAEKKFATWNDLAFKIIISGWNRIYTDIKDGYHDSEGDIIYLESLLMDDTIHNLPSEVFLDHDLRSLKDKLDKEDLKSMVKVFDPGIHKKKISPTYVSLSFEDRHYHSFTYVIQMFLPYFTYSVEYSSLPLSSGSEDIIFYPSIAAFHFSSLELVAYEYPMKVCSSTCFVPNITMI
ncbi:hypothetical protein Tco_0948710 [Tanacetum coccineum]